jgi:predicted PolB exonuclease-like 3'-5' exonuclease
MATAELHSRTKTDSGIRTAFLVLDTESIPDGRLLRRIKYPNDQMSEEEAIAKAQAEAREQSRTGSDFIQVSFQYPVAVCVIRVGADFGLQAITCLDAPQFRTREIVKKFWMGLDRYKAKLVTFNGRGFDLPLLELAAFRYGCTGRDYFYNSRNRYNGHIDLMDWISNYGACRLVGGLDLLSKILGKPGKMEMSGDMVYAKYREGKIQEINDYCMYDTLDTYFVFLRTRVLTGDLSLEQEHEVVVRAKEWLTAKSAELPALNQYLANWGDWEPWP